MSSTIYSVTISGSVKFDCLTFNDCNIVWCLNDGYGKVIMLFYHIQVDSVHKVRDFAFVHFHSHAAAKTALNRTNGKLLIDDEEVQVLVGVRYFKVTVSWFWNFFFWDVSDLCSWFCWFQEEVLRRGLWVVKVAPFVNLVL